MGLVGLAKLAKSVLLPSGGDFKDDYAWWGADGAGANPTEGRYVWWGGTSGGGVRLVGVTSGGGGTGGEGTMRGFLYHIHPKTIPAGAERFRYTWCMGGIAAALFGVELVTGSLLMFHYHPDPTRAYSDMVTIQEVVPFGDTVRMLHRLASHGLILAVFLHMLRVFLTGAYQAPRRLNWIVGVTLLVMTLGVAFTGYLLPWDETAYRAATVALRLVGLRASPESILLPGYVAHCLVLPGGMAGLMGYHFWKVRKDGGISGPL